MTHWNLRRSQILFGLRWSWPRWIRWESPMDRFFRGSLRVGPIEWRVWRERLPKEGR